MLCFYCGQGLRDWEDDDDPWIEHGRWSPTCSYVLLSKGKQFVDETCIMRDEVSKNNQEVSNFLFTFEIKLKLIW